MKGTQEKVDLLTQKPQESGQDRLTVTWKDLEAIVEHGLDLKAIKNSIKKVESAVDGQLGDPGSKKKVDIPPSKKMKKEVNAAGRSKNQAYNNAPPPAEGSRANDKPKCLRCVGGGWHESSPEQCRCGYKHTKLPAGFHEGKLGSSKWWEVENAAIRMYNLKNCFKNSDWGILVTDWQQLSNDEKDKYRVATAPAEKKSPAGALADALATINLEGLSGAQAMEDKPEVMAAPAVALGSTQHMRGFPVKTPEEYEAEAQLPSASDADEMQRKLPMPAALAADLANCQSCDDGDDSDYDCPDGLESGSDSDDAEIPLDEMPEDVVEQPKRRRVAVTAAAAAIQDKFGVTDFSVKGKLHAGTMEAEAYDRAAKEEDAQWPHRRTAHSYGTDLTQEQEAVSDSEYLLASTQPWLGMAVNPWGDENEDGSWSQQRLFVDRTGYARLCKLYDEDEELRLEAGFVRVTFARCGEERDVLETELLWPDFTLVDQKIDKETKFCVLSEKTRVQWELMEMMVRHTMGDGAHMAPMGSVTGEFQLPFYYEKDQRWSYQPLKYVRKVDVAGLRARLKLKIMLAACKSESDARDELDSYGARRAPPARPPARTHKTVTRDGKGPSGHALRPETASAPLRLLHQTWPEGHFDPGRKEYQPSVFQGTYQTESDTNSVDTAQESTWLDPAQIAELAQKDGQTIFLVSNKQMHRYSYSAALGQRGECLPLLGWQSAGCSGGLLGTIRQHVADIITDEELTDLARLHLIEGPQQRTLRVLRTRATPRAKAV
ncbi:hypothetical protein CYMTET_18959 [Cymbomonas tetramitiformis]|uniref:Uncharacterized protein n=1 Tax=Cymbomonas tetramitiformis TaxID=36881 RepID=A0AAE0L5N5_9CHLO|nr:hypothetical protein CYMTET_18959 [Cymbomonas tetramitiformis]